MYIAGVIGTLYRAIQDVNYVWIRCVIRTLYRVPIPSVIRTPHNTYTVWAWCGHKKSYPHPTKCVNKGSYSHTEVVGIGAAIQAPTFTCSLSCILLGVGIRTAIHTPLGCE